MKAFMTTTLLFIVTSPVHAQELKPPKEILTFRWMLGTWTGSGNIAFGRRLTKMNETVTFAIDGQFLRATSRERAKNFTMTKTELIGWEADKRRYVSYSFTNLAPSARIAHGKMTLGKLVMTSEPWKVEGMTEVSREKLVKMSARRYRLVLEFKSSNEWTKAMDYMMTKR